MKSRDAYVQQIQAALQRRAFQEALQAAEEALTAYGGDPELETLYETAQERMEAEPFLQTFMASGISLFQSGMYADALKQFEKIVALDPTYPEVQDWIEKAQAQVRPKPPESSPSTDPVRSLIQKGQALFDQGRYHEAIQTWMDVFMYDLTNAEVQDLIQQAQQRLAESRSRPGAPEADRPSEEAQHRTEVPPAPPTTPEEAAAAAYGEHLVAQALQAHREGRWEEAVRLWQQVLQDDPENLGAQTKYSEALRQLRIEGQFHRLLEDARAFWLQKKPDSAIHALQKAYRLRPDSPAVRQLVEEWNLSPAVLEPPPSAPTPSPATVVRTRRPSLRWTVWAAPVGGLVLLVLGGVWFLRSGKSRSPDVPTPSPPRPVVSKTAPAPRPTPPPSPTAPTGAPAAPPAVEPAPPPVSLTPTMVRRRDQFLQEARRAYARGDWDQAYEKLQEALRIDPQHPEARQMSAEVAAKVQEQEQAIAQRMAVVEGYYRSFDFDGAVYVLNKLREEFPQRRDILEMLKRTYYNAAVYYLRQYRCPLAEERLQVITLLDPTETRFREPHPLIRKCLKENGLTAPEDRERVQQLPYPLPLKD